MFNQLPTTMSFIEPKWHLFGRGVFFKKNKNKETYMKQEFKVKMQSSLILL